MKGFLQRQGLLLAVGGLVAAAAALVAGVMLPPVYQATAVVKVPSDPASYTSRLTSPQLLARVDHDQKLGMTTQNLARLVSARAAGGDRVEVIVRLDNAALARDIANTVAGDFVTASGDKAVSFSTAAGEPAHPVAPDLPLVALVGAVAGLLAGLGLAVWIDSR